MKIPFFNKKDKDLKQDDKLIDDKNKSDKGSIENKYLITVKEKLGSNTRNIKSFYAVRYLDNEDFVQYLYNKKLKFLELFPQQEKDFSDFSKDDVQKKLGKLKEKLKAELEEDTEEINDDDLNFEIMKLEAKLRHIKYSNDSSSYLTLGEDGVPEFIFIREGSTFHPVKWDINTKTIYTPSDNKKKSASMLLRNKEYKYTRFKDVVEGITIFLLVISGIFAIGGGYMYYKAYNLYDNSNIAEATRASLDVANQCGGVVLQTAEEAKRLTKETSDLLERFNDKILYQENVISSPPIREVQE
jgi:hypothetical protein